MDYMGHKTATRNVMTEFPVNWLTYQTDEVHILVQNYFNFKL